MKIMIIIMLVIASLSVYAANNEYPEFSNATLQGTCTSPLYGICPVGTSCNLSMRYPNNTVFFINTPVTLNGIYWNYIVSNISPPGKYYTAIICCHEAVCDNSIYTATVYSDTRIFGTLEFDSCPENIKESYTLIAITILALLLLFMSFIFRLWWMQTLSGLVIFLISFTIMGCGLILSVIGIIIGLIILITSLMRIK